jgi:hypothetical protein
VRPDKPIALIVAHQPFPLLLFLGLPVLSLFAARIVANLVLAKLPCDAM